MKEATMGDVEVGWRQQISTENRPWAIDVSPEMDVGDVVGAVTSTLTDLLTGLTFPAGLSGSPTGSGTILTQAVSNLVAGRKYRLVITANMGGSKQTSTVLLLDVPY
jgi:hypothetical protein